MASEPSLWYRIGYMVERARHARPAGERILAGLKERAPTTPGAPATRLLPGENPRPRGGGDRTPGASHDAPRSSRQPHGPSVDDLVSSLVAVAAGRLLGGGGKRTRPGGLLWLLRAGAAGAAAALLLDFVRPLLYENGNVAVLDPEVGDRMLAGLGQGLVYGAVVEPRVPGPALLKGALFGSAEYATEAAGGLGQLLRAHTPHGQVPGVGQLLEQLHPKGRAYLEHLVFGMALALLYGSSRSSNGIRIEMAEE